MDGIYYITVTSHEHDYELYWEGWAEHPAGALYKALNVREEQEREEEMREEQEREEEKARQEPEVQ